MKAIINELNPKVEGVRKVTLLEEVADCVLPWLEQLDIVMAQKLGKFQPIQRYFENVQCKKNGTVKYFLAETQISFRGIKISSKML